MHAWAHTLPDKEGFTTGSPTEHTLLLRSVEGSGSCLEYRSAVQARGRPRIRATARRRRAARTTEGLTRVAATLSAPTLAAATPTATVACPPGASTLSNLNLYRLRSLTCLRSYERAPAQRHMPFATQGISMQEQAV